MWVRCARSTAPFSFGERGGKHEQPQVAHLASLLELSRELAAAVDLQGAERERHARLQGVQELGRGAGGSPAPRLQHIPARDDVARSELLQQDARHGSEIQRVYLHQVAPLTDAPVAGFANRPEALTQASSRPAGPVTPPGPRAVSAASGCDRPSMPRPASLPPAEQDHELVFAPARVLAAQVSYPLDQLSRPGRLPPAVRPVLYRPCQQSF